ncbi:hypothetical protein AAGC94_07815 [Clostridium sporogenes]|uniref:Helix-turn-helix domain-containing protein n=1 Tax=Clostridium botulinum TaxID=1491 RepID=A0ABC8CZ24_CLOBO|nr:MULTISPECIES: hypothetical protein [Clostridium]AVQ40493.1 hypothetical protein C7M56_18130 [Clostridium botulinum]MBN3348303.1 hypothetical protein [Clostridium botulinum]MBO0573435.1 hypothetical protein [Clostridium botulinum]MCW6091337.1 hypothetical protein [Clostridium sporogenes]NFA99030.1 hypothetical protein [Clostridium botulinum]
MSREKKDKFMTLNDYFKKKEELQVLNNKKDMTVDEIIRRGRIEIKVCDYDFAIKHFLKKEQQQYIYLKYIKKLSIKQISIMMGKHRSTLYRFEKNIVNRINSIW